MEEKEGDLQHSEVGEISESRRKRDDLVVGDDERLQLLQIGDVLKHTSRSDGMAGEDREGEEREKGREAAAGAGG